MVLAVYKQNVYNISLDTMVPKTTQRGAHVIILNTYLPKPL